MPVKLTITIEHPVEAWRQFAEDIMTTAVEGGINYWCDSIKTTRRGEDEGDRALSVISFLALPAERPAARLCTWGTIERGITRILDRSVGIRPDLYAQVQRGATQLDAGEIDADGADCIVQAGLFGELVYG